MVDGFVLLRACAIRRRVNILAGKLVLALFLSLACLACAPRQRVIAVAEPYRIEPTPYLLLVMTNSPPLDFSSVDALTRSLRKNANGKHDGTVGHAWIRVSGPEYELECGHTGQEGYEKMGYQEGVLHLIRARDPNPIRYLWEDLHDGRMQGGSGGFEPTLSVARHITREQYQTLIDYVNQYDFKSYSLQGNQCTTFVTGALAAVGLLFDATVEIPVVPIQSVLGAEVRLWTDERYRSLKVPMPQRLESELVRAVQQGVFADNTSWYPLVDSRLQSDNHGHVVHQTQQPNHRSRIDCVPCWIAGVR